MRNLIYVACIVALCAAVFGLSALVSAPATSAQQPKFEAPRQGYADVEAAARKLLAAYATGDAEKLWESLAAPRRNSCALALARSIRRYEEKPESFEKFKTRMPKLDPAGKLKMKTLDDLRAMRPADFFALTTGMLVASATENVRARLKGQWYMVEREIGLTQLRELRGAAEIVTRGYVCFENLEGDLIKVGCMPDDDGWRMTTFDVKVGDFHRGFTGTFALGGVQGQMGDAEISEARAALGAMKDRARVVYQRTGNAPATLKELGLTDVELRGSYFDASHYLITNASPERWTAACSGVYSAAPQELIVTADLAKGSATFNR